MYFTCNGFSCLDSLNNSREIAIFVGWKERPFTVKIFLDINPEIAGYSRTIQLFLDFYPVD